MNFLKIINSQVGTKKSFVDQLSDVKSVFQKAFNDASSLSEQCKEHVQKKQVEIKEIETEILATDKVRNDAESFMGKLKDLI